MLDELNAIFSNAVLNFSFENKMPIINYLVCLQFSGSICIHYDNENHIPCFRNWHWRPTSFKTSQFTTVNKIVTILALASFITTEIFTLILTFLWVIYVLKALYIKTQFLKYTIIILFDSPIITHYQ